MLLPISHRVSRPGRHRVRLSNMLRPERDALHGDGVRAGQLDSLLGRPTNCLTSGRFGTSLAMASRCPRLSSAPTPG